MFDIFTGNDFRKNGFYIGFHNILDGLYFYTGIVIVFIYAKKSFCSTKFLFACFYYKNINI